MAFYWYQSDPDLYRAEVQAMNKFFPSFTIHQLPDGSGRLYWRGKVQPAGPDGMVWDLMLIYKNDHPHAGDYGYGGYAEDYGQGDGPEPSHPAPESFDMGCSAGLPGADCCPSAHHPSHSLLAAVCNERKAAI